MKYVKQPYFDDFICIADKCKDTCCKGWEIEIDDECYDRYLTYEGNLKDKLEMAFDKDNRVITFNEDSRCYFLREDGLCEMVLDSGEESLCNTCHTYPRHIEEYEDVREYSLALSCPHAAEMVLEKSISEYVEYEDDLPDPFEEDYEDFNPILFQILEESRRDFYKMIHKEELSADEVLGSCLEYSRIMQIKLDEDRIFELEAGELFNIGIFRVSKEFSLFDYFVDNLPKLLKLEVLREDYSQILDRTKELLDLDKAEFDRRINLNNYFDKKDTYLKNMFESLIYTYFLGAVYDGMVYAKVSIAVFFTVMTDIMSSLIEIDDARERFIRMAYTLAREIEHSDENINTLFELFDKEI